MTYLSDRKSKRFQLKYRLIGVAILVFVCIFWVQIRIFSSPAVFAASELIFITKATVLDTASEVFSWFRSKSTLLEEIALLEDENARIENELAEKNALIASYTDAYMTDTKLTHSTIEVFPLYSPLTSVYGTFMISKGFSDGIEEDQVIYGTGYIPVGKVIKVGTKTSQVKLLSASGNELEGLILASSSDKTVLRLTGMGGGDYVAVLPKDIAVDLGANVSWRENPTMMLGTVVSIDNEPQAVTQKLLIKGRYNPTNAPRLYIDLP